MGQVGLSYGVLYRGEQILVTGHGFRNEARGLPADENTLYNIASCTKAFTATAIVLLAQEGRLDLNLPVKQYVPELKDDQITLVDLLAHRTGYGRLDMSWVGMRSEVLVTHAELLDRINALPRICPLRSKWLYNNWMYALAAVVIERTSEEGNYLEFMRNRVIAKYGLTRTCIERKYLPDDDNITLAYAASQSGQRIEIAEPPWEESPFTAGGGIRSSVSDMLVWSGHLLRAYNYEANHPVNTSEEAPAHPGVIFAPRMILPEDISLGELERTYGMGFMRLMLPSVLAYGTRNKTVANSVHIPPVGGSSHHTFSLSHCGENAGALACFVLLPELESAIVVLGNTTALGDANELVTHLLASLVINSPTRLDYEALAGQIATECKTWHDRTIAGPLAEHRLGGSAFPDNLSQYTGTYSDAKFQYTMRVSLKNGGLVLHLGGKESQRACLAYSYDDTFSFATESYDQHVSLGMIDYDNWNLFTIPFQRDGLGEVMALNWSLDVNLPPVVLRLVV